VSTIGENILIFRKRKGWTQEELAQRMGYKSKSTINKIELGKSDIPQSKIAQFAAVFDTTPAHLMGWETEKINLHLFDGGESEPPLTEGEKSLLEAFRKLTPENQELALQMLLGALERLQ
jgi:transcriptional regulator with XRE-family HTH domain